MSGSKECVFGLLFGFGTLIIAVLAADCPMGYYGDQCMETCSNHCMGVACDPDTGACDGDCEEGWSGIACDEPCQSGFYGSNCTKECSGHCVRNSCHTTNGTCTDGCKRGYVGAHCEQVCAVGYYGPGCSKRCSNNCKKGECHPSNGHCLMGCKADFWGSDCSLFGNFHEAASESQDKFYNRLSAESKSVLLYILMGQYEDSLERAQEEISRGLRQRSELRQLIGD